MRSEVKKIVHELFDIGAFKVDTKTGFTLALHEKDPSAPRSPFYLNLRTQDNPKAGHLSSGLVKRIALQIAEAAHTDGIRYTHVCGIPNAGTPFAKSLQEYWRSVRSPVGILSMTKSELGGGRTFSVDRMPLIRPAPIEERVLLIDDLVTSETVKRVACEALRAAHYTVPAIAVFLDRRARVAPVLSDGTLLCSVLTISEMLDEYEESGRLSSEDLRVIRRYLGL